MENEGKDTESPSPQKGEGKKILTPEETGSMFFDKLKKQPEKMGKLMDTVGDLMDDPDQIIEMLSGKEKGKQLEKDFRLVADAVVALEEKTNRLQKQMQEMLEWQRKNYTEKSPP